MDTDEEWRYTGCLPAAKQTLAIAGSDRTACGDALFVMTKWVELLLNFATYSLPKKLRGKQRLQKKSLDH